MLPATALPYTGPYYGPSSIHGPMKGPTAKALKRALIRLKYFKGDLSQLDEHYNRPLETAMKRWQRSLVDVQPSGQYGLGSWNAMRAAKVLDGPHKGEYAMDGIAQKLIQDEWEADQIPTAEDVRKAITSFCLEAESHEYNWHYSQQRPYTGLGVVPQNYHVNDCSSYVILAYFWAKKETGIAVPDPSKHGYSGAGNTWNDLDGHVHVTGNFLISDLAHYDGHVTVCRRAGDGRSSIWSSMGSEKGPRAEQLHYRDDLLFVVRPPLGTS